MKAKDDEMPADQFEPTALSRELSDAVIDKIFSRLNNREDIRYACAQENVSPGAFMAMIASDEEKYRKLFRLMNLVAAGLIFENLGIANRINSEEGVVPKAAQVKFDMNMKLAGILAPVYFSKLAEKAAKKKMYEGMAALDAVQEEPAGAVLDAAGKTPPKEIEASGTEKKTEEK